MGPAELKILIAIVTSYLYEKLTKTEFFNLALFLSILAKEMYTMEALADLVKIEEIEDKEECTTDTQQTKEEAEISELEEEALLESDVFGLPLIGEAIAGTEIAEEEQLDDEPSVTYLKYPGAYHPPLYKTQRLDRDFSREDTKEPPKNPPQDKERQPPDVPPNNGPPHKRPHPPGRPPKGPRRR